MTSRSATTVGLLAIFLGMGCARTSTLTTVKEDGSWHRTVKLFFQAQNAGGLGDVKQSEPKIEDVFTPPSGSGWSIERSKASDGTLQLVAQRDLKAGQESQNDIVVKGQLSNTVTVKEISPGRFEYRETLHWTGKKQDLLATASPSLLTVVKDALGSQLATKENVDFIVLGLGKAVTRIMFGPGDPMLGQLIAQPELSERRLRIRIAESVNALIATRFGTSVSAEDRLKMSKKLLAELDSKQFIDPEKQGEESKGSTNSQLVSMFFSVKLPGAIIETNGESDPFTGEVFWAMYPEVAQFEDVVLRSVCEVKK